MGVSHFTYYNYGNCWVQDNSPKRWMNERKNENSLKIVIFKYKLWKYISDLVKNIDYYNLNEKDSQNIDGVVFWF